MLPSVHLSLSVLGSLPQPVLASGFRMQQELVICNGWPQQHQI